MVDGMTPFRVIHSSAAGQDAPSVNDIGKPGIGSSGRGQRQTILKQTTLKNAIHCSGVGVHGGQKTCMTLKPAAADSGILFQRSDLPGQPTIPALWSQAVESPLCSKIVATDCDASVSTIEHLMAALVGCGVDNALIEIDGSEVPIMDGSAAPFVFLIECAGIASLAAPRKAIRVLKPIEVSEPHRTARLLPHDGFSVDFAIHFDSKAVGGQRFACEVTPTSFKQEISRARTFGFLQEVDQLRKLGLAKGGSLDNAIVIDDGVILNSGGLRYVDEFVRHKALDSIGDLYMAGRPLIAGFEGNKAGHALTLRLLQALFANPANYAEVELTEATAEDDLLLAAGA
ncbi:UDP-3-O-acyl-N-acetylglucosamine deacetylase [Algihabitans albus]|uniref:UDP-3-O-acyl-N-acetylglucosamine deacetylase n=1 Tax=Algihabitans albus TaxID=2164067 RepID=UPI001F21AFB4|nr:UDP-3-O-acyl-N-acetylglucosamine deacetylase [Algihabitans albus]